MKRNAQDIGYAEMKRILAKERNNFETTHEEIITACIELGIGVILGLGILFGLVSYLLAR